MPKLSPRPTPPMPPPPPFRPQFRLFHYREYEYPREPEPTQMPMPAPVPGAAAASPLDAPAPSRGCGRPREAPVFSGGAQFDVCERSLVPECAFLRAGTVFRGEQRVAACLKPERWAVQVTVTSYDPLRGVLAGTIEAFEDVCGVETALAALARVSFDQEPSKDTLRRRRVEQGRAAARGDGRGASSERGHAGGAAAGGASSEQGRAGGAAAGGASAASSRRQGSPSSSSGSGVVDGRSAFPSGLAPGSSLARSGRFVKTAWEGEVVDGLFRPLLPDGVAGTPSARAEVALWTRFPAFRAAAERGVAAGDLPGALAAADAVFLRLRETAVISGADETLTITGRYVLCLDRATGAVAGAYRDDGGAPDQEIDLRPIRGAAGYASGSAQVA